MRKKLLCLFVLLGSFAGAAYFYSSQNPPAFPANGYCPFCDTKILEYQKFYEDDLVLALYTHKPILPCHCLIIPKRHVERFELLTEEEITQMGRVIKAVNLAAPKVFETSSYLLLQKNGLEVGQSVPHVHFHYIGRKVGNDSTLALLAKMFLDNFRDPISPIQMQENVDKLKDAIK